MWSINPCGDEVERLAVMWEQYAFDPRERAVVGQRTREWTAVAPTELAVIRELTRCFRSIRDGQVPT